MEIKTSSEPAKENDLVQKTNQDVAGAVIAQKAKETTNVKDAIDLLATDTALKQTGTVEKIVAEKTEELKNDAEAKRIQAETEKIRQQVDKVKQESEREIAELEKEKNRLQAEVEQMSKEADKAKAYFEANKDILKCIGIHSPKTLKVMQAWMYPATIIFALLQILKLPITICGALLEGIIDVVGGVCGGLKNQALRIVISVAVILLLAGAIGCSIWGGNAIIQLIRR